MTAIGVLFLGYLLMLALTLAGVLAFARHHPPGPSGTVDVRDLAQSLACTLGGYVLLGLRWWWPLPLLEAPGCGLLLAGYVGMIRAVAAEEGGGAPAWPLLGAAVLVTVLAAMGLWLGWSLETRLLLFWLCTGFATLPWLPALLAMARSPQGWPNRAIALLFLIAAPLVLWRVVEQWMLPSPGPRIGSGLSPAQAVILLYFPSLPLLASYSLLQLRQRHGHHRIQYLATHDLLTGLGNRYTFDEFGTRAVQARPRPGGRLCALMIDIDHFKEVNDRHGHAAGDAALKRVGQIVAGAVREGDISARLGGDEFAILLVDAQPGVAADVAARIRRELARTPDKASVGREALTLSIGIAELHDEDGSLDALMRRADHQLYIAKQSGRNRVAIEPPALRHGP